MISSDFLGIHLIALAVIPICPKQDVRHPRWGSAHLFADSVDIDAGITFDDQFIMNMTYDGTVA